MNKSETYIVDSPIVVGEIIEIVSHEWRVPENKQKSYMCDNVILYKDKKIVCRIG
jgi:hypothetical protein